MIELRCGDWREVLKDVVECDAVITDPPYAKRTHGAQCHGRRGVGYRDSWVTSAGLGYNGLTARDVREFCAAWSHVVGWVVALSCSDLFPVWRAAMSSKSVGRYAFAPVPCVITGMNVRLCGDGPSSWAVYLNASRPTSLKEGTLPGAYVVRAETGPKRAKLIPGSKPLSLMRAIIRDYTKPGDLIVDPFAGSGTTLIAARQEGRDCIGAEIDPETYEKAMKRINKPWTPSLVMPDAGPTPKTGKLL